MLSLPGVTEGAAELGAPLGVDDAVGGWAAAAITAAVVDPLTATETGCPPGAEVAAKAAETWLMSCCCCCPLPPCTRMCGDPPAAAAVVAT